MASMATEHLLDMMLQSQTTNEGAPAKKRAKTDATNDGGALDYVWNDDPEMEQSDFDEFLTRLKQKEEG